VPLYKDGEPVWHESPEGFEQVDLIAIAMAPIRERNVYTWVERFAPYIDKALSPGVEVCLIGFPFGLTPSNPFPIWKRAMVSSEPSLPLEGRRCVFLDMPGRPGMSGSPVYFVGPGFRVTREEGAALYSGDLDRMMSAFLSIPSERMADSVQVLEFVGVYSGSYGDENLDRLNLGRFWPAYHLKEIGTSPRRGRNPCPPV
jgi:hypothetical protein